MANLLNNVLNIVISGSRLYNRDFLYFQVEERIAMVNLNANLAEMDPSEIVIPGIDANLGSNLYGGEMDIYVSILRSFTSSIPATIEKLRNVSEGTLAKYATAVHGLKGSCASIAAEVTREKAFDLEKKAKAGDISGVLAQNEEMLKEAEQLVRDIQTWLSKIDQA
jgi:HPt (histidine-containing phosphotransfer) domain-containing protein